MEGASHLSSPLRNTSCKRMDKFCREQICEWSYRVMDYFKIEREVVVMSMAYVDRFLSNGSCDRRTFKLAAMTSLYLAVKVLHPLKLNDLGVLSDLSRGEFDMVDLAEMERLLLSSLSWHLHPPTSSSFIYFLLELVLPDNDFEAICNIGTFFAELAACDYFFVTQRPSLIALSAIMNAFEAHVEKNYDHWEYAKKISDIIQVPLDCEEMLISREKLWDLYERSEECWRHRTTTGPAVHVFKSSESDENFPAVCQRTRNLSNLIHASSPICVSKP